MNNENLKCKDQVHTELRGFYDATDSELKRRSEFIERLENCVVRLSGSSPIERVPTPSEPDKIRVDSILGNLSACHSTDVQLNENLYLLVERLDALI